MLKFLILVIAIAAVSANLAPRHRYQVNEQKALGKNTNRGSRIVGGSDAEIENYPHMASYFMNGNHRCGGSVLNSNTILSAAHCTHGVNPLLFQLFAGSNDNRNLHLAHNLLWLEEHPQYDDWTLENDVVIMRHVGHWTFGANLQPANLPTPNFQVGHGAQCTVTGWGNLEWGVNIRPHILQSVDVPAMTNAHCQAIYYEETILPTHLCAGEYGRDACQGDSGGPLIYNNVLVGVVNWGYGCAFEWPTVYARVSEFLGFITTQMNRP